VAALSNKDAIVLEFELAVEAIIAGDEPTLQSLLKRYPKLTEGRSTRYHRATLLHYVAANGVEGYRQRTPKNAVRIARILLKTGAEVDADLEYGEAGTKRYPERLGSTTLGLAATSFHPAAAGVQIALLRTLLKAGASVNGLKGGWNPLVAALHNGRGEAARYLGRQGARLDLEGAAGVGRLDVVKRYFSRDGCLKATANREQMEAGFMWACEYGRRNVVSFLLKNGMDIAAQPHGETGLHWASYGGYPEIVDALLRRGSSVDLRDKRFGATPLSWVLHGWCYPPPEAKARARQGGYYRVAASLVAAGAKLDDVQLDAEQLQKLRGDRKMRVALGIDKSRKSAGHQWSGLENDPP
jgi:ankyrin repeat protein